VRLYRLRRHPFGFWLVTFLLAGLTAAVVLRAGESADRWGRLAPVVVVAREVAPGSMLGADDVRVDWWPARLVPSDAVASVDDAAGRVAVVALWPGEPVLRGRLAPDGLSGVAALVPIGMRAVALPVDGPALELRVGDWVDVLATFESEPTVVVAESVPVVAVAESAVTVAVPADLAPKLAYALTRSTLTLAQVPFSTTPGVVEKAGGGQ
jgi:pilus assembly protein CpaB